MIPDVRKDIKISDLLELLNKQSRGEKLYIEHLIIEDDIDKSTFSGKTLSDIIFRDCILKNISFSFSILSNMTFKNCEMPETNFGHAASITRTEFYNSDVSKSRFNTSSLFKVNFRESDLSNSTFVKSEIKDSSFYICNLSNINFRNLKFQFGKFVSSNLRNSKFIGAKFEKVYFDNSNLLYVDFSQSTGLISPIDYLKENFEWTDKGLIVYKIFDLYYSSPWGDLKPGMIINEEVNHDRTLNCACGINVTNKQRLNNMLHRVLLSKLNGIVWECLIRNKWLPCVVVPYNTSGKIRAGRIELIKEYSLHKLIKGR